MIDDDRKTPTKVPRAKRGGFINYFLYYRIISKLKRERGMTFILKFTVFMQYPEITEGLAPQCLQAIVSAIRLSIHPLTLDLLSKAILQLNYTYK